MRNSAQSSGLIESITLGVFAVIFCWVGGGPVGIHFGKYLQNIVEFKWGIGGTTYWSPWAFLIVGSVSFLYSLVRYRTSYSKNQLLLLVPWMVLIILLMIGIFNRSHTVDRGVGYPPIVEVRDFVKYLPSAVEPWRSSVLVAQGAGSLCLFGSCLFGLKRGRDMRAVLWFVYGNGLSLAFVGSLFHISGNQKLLGIFDVINLSYFASFGYKNHWVAIALLSMCSGLALCSHYVKNNGWNDKQGRLLFILLTLPIIVITIPMKGSRAGMLLLLMFICGLMLGAVRMLLKRSRYLTPAKTVFAGAFCALTLGATIYYNAFEIEKRIRDTQHEWGRLNDGAGITALASGRLDACRYGLLMFKDKPMLGWGPGSYGVLLPSYAENYMPLDMGLVKNGQWNNGQTATFEFTHSDWVQLLAELGLVGCVLFLVPPVFLVAKSWGKIWNSGPALWLVFGVLLVVSEGSLEFPFAVPAVCYISAVLLPLAINYSALDLTITARRK